MALGSYCGTFVNHLLSARDPAEYILLGGGNRRHEYLCRADVQGSAVHGVRAAVFLHRDGRLWLV